MLKGCLISGITEFSNHKMSRLCQTPEDESQGAKGLSLTGSPSQAGTFENSLGGYMNTIIGGKIKVQTHRSLSLILLKGLSWFHTTRSWIRCSFFYFFSYTRRPHTFVCHTNVSRGEHINLGAFTHSDLGSTGNKCPQSSITGLMRWPLTSEAKAEALVQIGIFKDFISERDHSNDVASQSDNHERLY